MNSTQFLNQSASKQTASIAAYEYMHEKVWLKKISKRHKAWIYAPLNWFAKLLQLDALVAVPNYGGVKAIQCEYERITALRQLGIQTPVVLAVSDHGILLQDAGLQRGQPVIQLDHALAQSNSTSKKIELYAHAVDAVLEVHQKGSYLSEAFARNILVSPDYQFTFIDFETDPREQLNLMNCQIRDWLCFIFSTAYRLELEEINLASQLFFTRLQASATTLQAVNQVGRKLQWIARLKPEKLGNDGKRIQKCLLFFQALALGNTI